MATGTATTTPRRDSVVNGINSPEDTAEVARQFVSALKAFSSEHGYRNLAELVDRIPKLEAGIREKEKIVKLANETCERERVAHTGELKKSLSLYTEEYDRFQRDKVSFKQRTADLEASLTSKDKTVLEMEKKEVALKSAGKQIEDMCKAMKTKVKEKEIEIAKMKKHAEEIQTSAESLSVALQETRAEMSALQKSFGHVKQHNAQLEKAQTMVNAQLEEINSYSVRLENIDSGIL